MLMKRGAGAKHPVDAQLNGDDDPIQAAIAAKRKRLAEMIKRVARAAPTDVSTFLCDDPPAKSTSADFFQDLLCYSDDEDEDSEEEEDEKPEKPSASSAPARDHGTATADDDDAPAKNQDDLDSEFASFMEQLESSDLLN
eukprot:gene20734-27550_t